MISKKLIGWAIVPALLVTGAYAYRVATPIVVGPPAALPAVLATQITANPGGPAGPVTPKPILSAAFSHENKIHGFAFNVFRRPGAFFLQLAPHVDPDYMDYLVDPIDIGAASVEYTVLGQTFVYQFGSVGNVWITSIPNSVAVGGVLGDAVLRVWRVGSDYTDPAAAAFTRDVGVTPF